MKKICAFMLVAFLMGTVAFKAFAAEITIEGKGSTPIVSYDSKASMPNDKQELKLLEIRKKQLSRINNSVVNNGIINASHDTALEAAIISLINTTFNDQQAYKRAEIKANFQKLIDNADSFIINKEFKDEIIDNKYVSTVLLTVDSDKFINLLSTMDINK